MSFLELVAFDLPAPDIQLTFEIKFNQRSRRRNPDFLLVNVSYANVLIIARSITSILVYRGAFTNARVAIFALAVEFRAELRVGALHACN